MFYKWMGFEVMDDEFIASSLVIHEVIKLLSGVQFFISNAAHWYL